MSMCYFCITTYMFRPQSHAICLWKCVSPHDFEFNIAYNLQWKNISSFRNSVWSSVTDYALFYNHISILYSFYSQWFQDTGLWRHSYSLRIKRIETS